MTEKAHIVQGLVGLTTTQDRYFKDTFRNVGMSLEECAAFEPPRSVLAFQDFVVRTAIEESYEGSLVVVLAAEWMYLTWSKEAYQYGPRNPHYAEWIRIHVSPDFEANVGWIRQQLDTNGPMLALHRQQRLAFLFRRTLELEVDFHNAPYDHLPTGSR
jgi:thiaminase/transcriptional activator TenA